MVEQPKLDMLWVDHPLSGQTEEWNGTNWSEGPAVDAGSAGRRSDAGGCALQVKCI